MFGLLGANGAGKTTTLKTAVGLLRPEQGSVRLFGMPITDVRARARKGFLPEQPYFYDYLTGREFLDFYARLCGIAPSRRAARVAEMQARRFGVALQGPASASGQKAATKLSAAFTVCQM